MIIENVNGNVNNGAIGEYDEGIYMMKYNEVGILGKEDMQVIRKLGESYEMGR